MYYVFFFKEPFRIAFVETMYTITESEGQVEVCVNLTYPPVNILNEIVRMESYNYESSIYIPPNALLASKLPSLVAFFDLMFQHNIILFFIQLLTCQTSLEYTLWQQGLIMKNNYMALIVLETQSSMKQEDSSAITRRFMMMCV